MPMLLELTKAKMLDPGQLITHSKKEPFIHMSLAQFLALS